MNNIDLAVSQFRTLLEEQIARSERMRDVPLMGETRKGHVNRITREQWERL